MADETHENPAPQAPQEQSMTSRALERVVGRAGLDDVAKRRRSTITMLRTQAEIELKEVQDQLVVHRAVLRELERQETDLLRFIHRPG